MQSKDEKRELKTDARFIRALKCTAKILDASEMIYLAQLISADEYFENKPDREENVFYTTREYTEEETGLSPDVQRRCEKGLVRKGLIKAFNSSYEANRYMINYRYIEKLEEEYIIRHAEFIEKRKQRKDDSFHVKYREEAIQGEKMWVGHSGDADNGWQGVPNEDPEGGYSKALACPMVGANNNIDIITKNKNKKNSTTEGNEDADISATRSKLASDVFMDVNRTALNESTGTPILSGISLGSIPAAGRSKRSLRSIVDAYNEIMGYKFSASDMRAALKGEEELRRVEQYINAIALPFIWSRVADDGARKSVTEPTMAAFVGYNIPKKIIEKEEYIRSYCLQELDIKLDQLFKRKRETLAKYVEGSGYKCEISGSLEPIARNACFTPREHREMRCRIVREHLLPLLPKDERYDIIKAMEVL